MLHLNVWLSSPPQSNPPNLGEGLSHVRVRNRVPVPHVFVHSVNTVHSEKPPLTNKAKTNNYMTPFDLEMMAVII